MTLRVAILLAALLAAAGGTAGADPPSTGQVLASEILDLASEGQPVHYQDTTIVGDLNLSALPEGRAKAALELINCTLGDASFSNVIFEGDVVLVADRFGNVSFDQAVFEKGAHFGASTFDGASFAGVIFRKPAVFDASLIRGPCSFIDAQFNADTSFNYVVFHDVDFNYSRLAGYSFFCDAQFLGNASFSDMDFGGTADFGSANFSGRACFIRSEFDSGASFTDALFQGPAQFGLTGFSGLSSFGNATFLQEANFALDTFSDAAYFSGARFLDTALLALVKFEDIASFQQASFAGDLILKGSSISTLLMDDGLWAPDSRIILNDSSFVRLKVHWKDLSGHLVWDPGSYLALVNNYRNLGWSQDEDDCYYQYRYLDQNQKPLGFSKAIDILAWLTCGYGVRPSYSVVWSLLTILAFALVFWQGDGIRRSARPLQGPAEKDSVPERVTFRNALFFSTMIFLSQGPIDFLPMGRHRYYVILEGILGWLLLALFLVTLGKVMIR